MSRTIIVARIRPGTEREVARIFGASDATPLPEIIGVRQRSLYSLNDLYVHVVDIDDGDEPQPETLERARALAGFKQVCEDLAPYISPYDSTWGRPQDAVATEFYRWTPGVAVPAA